MLDFGVASFTLLSMIKVIFAGSLLFEQSCVQPCDKVSSGVGDQ